MPETRIERGRTGRLLYGRVRPNEDLCGAIADLCRDNGFAAALVRGSLGSLTEAVLETAGGRKVHVTGAAVETLSLGGEVRTEGGVLQAHLAGTVSDAEGRVFGGRFVPGRNPVCVTFELALEEWIADAP